MEALLLLANFGAMLLVILWSGREEARGDEGGERGLFAYYSSLQHSEHVAARSNLRRR